MCANCRCAPVEGGVSCRNCKVVGKINCARRMERVDFQATCKIGLGFPRGCISARDPDSRKERRRRRLMTNKNLPGGEEKKIQGNMLEPRISRPSISKKVLGGKRSETCKEKDFIDV